MSWKPNRFHFFCCYRPVFDSLLFRKKYLCESHQTSDLLKSNFGKEHYKIELKMEEKKTFSCIIECVVHTQHGSNTSSLFCCALLKKSKENFMFCAPHVCVCLFFIRLYLVKCRLSFCRWCFFFFSMLLFNLSLAVRILFTQIQFLFVYEWILTQTK